MPGKQKAPQVRSVGVADRKPRQWVESLRIGLAIAEEAGALEDAARIQILNAKGKVLFTAVVATARR